MSDKMFSVDFQDVQKNLQVILQNTIPELAQDGLYQAGKQLLRDSVELPPKVPIGHYRAKAGKRTGVGGALKRSGKVAKMQDGSVVVGFNMPYASVVHAGKRSDGTHVIKNWTEPGAGKEFISKKIEQYKSVYLHLIAAYIKRRSGA